MSRASTLLWLALVLGSLAEPARSEVALAAPVERVREQLRDGQLDAAIAAGEAAVKSLAQDSHAWLWLGRAYGQQAMMASLLAKPKWAGRTRDAFEKAVELDAANLDARFDLMQYYLAAPGFMGGGRDKADAQAAAIQAKDPVFGLLADAVMLDQDSKPQEAERAVRKALELDPDRPRSRIALSMRLQREERWDESRALWQAQLQHPEHATLAHYQLGRLAAISGQELLAGLEHLDHYQRSAAVSEYMLVSGAYWRRGQILEKLGRRDEALAAYREALRLKPGLAPAKSDLERLQKA